MSKQERHTLSLLVRGHEIPILGGKLDHFHTEYRPQSRLRFPEDLFELLTMRAKHYRESVSHSEFVCRC